MITIHNHDHFCVLEIKLENLPIHHIFKQELGNNCHSKPASK